MHHLSSFLPFLLLDRGLESLVYLKINNAEKVYECFALLLKLKEITFGNGGPEKIVSVICGGNVNLMEAAH